MTLPLVVKSTLEPLYLLGYFAVSPEFRLGKLPEKLKFGDITKLGFPFYSGNITYHLPDYGRVSVKVDAAAVYAEVGGKPLCFAPFEADTEGQLDITVMPGRHNTFGALHNKHNTSGSPESFLPNPWDFSEQPVPQPRGLIAKPCVRKW